MPVGLPSTANTFDVIRPGNALNKFVFIFVLLSGVVTELVEEGLSLGEGLRVLFLEDIVSNSSGEQVGLRVPSEYRCS